MTFVVVYLIGAREFTVVPSIWVKDLTKAKLMNYGANTNQDFRVFWAANNGKPNFDAEINFNTPIATTLRSTGEACYPGRIKKCFGKLNQSLEIDVSLICVGYSTKAKSNLAQFSSFKAILSTKDNFNRLSSRIVSLIHSA